MMFGLLSDIHFYNKPYRLRSALRLLKHCKIILIAGDIADRGTEQQFLDVLNIFSEEVPDTAIFTVPGNHDISCDHKAYRFFKEKVYKRFSSGYSMERSETGAYYTQIEDDTDLTGLSPMYCQKLFHFPQHGEQLDFLESHLRKSTAARHIIMCHPPLIAHNPQRTMGMHPYMPKEQDQRLQEIVDRYGNIFFLSGHTHFTPAVERDDLRHNVYINDGSINPVTACKAGETHPENVFKFDMGGMVQCAGIKKPDRRASADAIT